MAAFNRPRNLIRKWRGRGDAPATGPSSREEQKRQQATIYRIHELERLLDSEYPTLEMAPFIAELGALISSPDKRPANDLV